MALLENWQKIAYNEKTNKQELQRFWQRYFLVEKGVYEKLLTNPDEKVEGTVKELADRYGLSILDMTGFLDGINESLVKPNPIETMEEDTKVSLAFHKDSDEKPYVQHKIMQQASALFEWIQNGAYLYLCGEKEPMGKEVEAALLTVIAQEGKLSKEEAAKYFEQLKTEGRYAKDLY